MKKYIASFREYRTLDTCDIKSGDYFFDKYKIDDYGVDENMAKKLSITEHKYFLLLIQIEQLMKILKEI